MNNDALEPRGAGVALTISIFFSIQAGREIDQVSIRGSGRANFLDTVKFSRGCTARKVRVPNRHAEHIYSGISKIDAFANSEIPVQNPQG